MTEPHTVKNKDILLLQDVPLLKVEIVSLEQRRTWERERMTRITASLSSLPGGGTKRGMDDVMAALDELERRHADLIRQYTRLIKKAEKILNGIASHQMRTMVTLLYLDNVADSAVQSVLHMSRYAFENAKKPLRRPRIWQASNGMTDTARTEERPQKAKTYALLGAKNNGQKRRNTC